MPSVVSVIPGEIAELKAFTFDALKHKHITSFIITDDCDVIFPNFVVSKLQHT